MNRTEQQAEFDQPIQGALRNLERQIESRLSDETRHLVDEINDRIAQVFEQSGLNYDRYTNHENADAIALQVYRLGEVIKERRKNGEFKRLVEQLGQEILQRAEATDTP